MNHYQNKGFFNKLERKLGKYAIPNLSLYLIVCYAIGFVTSLANSDALNYLTLNPQLILHGQVWRIFSWILIPPDMSNLFFMLLMLYFYYSIGTSLERVWGTFYYNLYMFSGMIFTVLGSFLLYAFCELGIMGSEVTAMVQLYGSAFYQLIGAQFSTFYINMSIFLAYAATFPEMEVYLMMIFPIKVKWLGIIDAIMLGIQFLTGGFITRIVIGASLFNFVVFFLTTRNRMQLSPRQIKRRHEFKREVKKTVGVTKHKCAICGRTEEDDENLEFRFCSKCEGNYEYCQEHLFTHVHVKRH